MCKDGGMFGYTAYTKFLKTYPDLPQWLDLSPRVRNMWRLVAEETLGRKGESLEDETVDPETSLNMAEAASRGFDSALETFPESADSGADLEPLRADPHDE